MVNQSTGGVQKTKCLRAVSLASPGPSLPCCTYTDMYDYFLYG
jgi:hypothetical protein